jgi:uncharacterized membrane protein HdeD (DUF308 family)
MDLRQCAIEMEEMNMEGTMEAPDGLRDVSGAWWLVMLVGLLCMAAGVIVLAQPDVSLSTLAVIAGIFLLIDGLFEIVASFSKSTDSRGPLALLGVLSLIVGIVLVRHPFGAVSVLALFIGIWLVCVGAVRLIEAFAIREGRGWNLVVSLVEIVAGVVIVSSPDIGVKTLALLIGITFLLRGIGLAVSAWGLRDVHKEVAA